MTARTVVRTENLFNKARDFFYKTRYRAGIWLMAVVALGAAVPEAQAAARSVHVQLNNQSDSDFVLSSYNLTGGCWTTVPPDRVEAGTTVTWESESCGFGTGTEG